MIYVGNLGLAEKLLKELFPTVPAVVFGLTEQEISPGQLGNHLTGLAQCSESGGTQQLDYEDFIIIVRFSLNTYTTRWYDLSEQVEDEVSNFGWVKALHPKDRERSERLWKQPMLEMAHVRKRVSSTHS